MSEKVREVNPSFVLCGDMSGNCFSACWRRRWEVSVAKSLSMLCSFVDGSASGVLLAFSDRTCARAWRFGIWCVNRALDFCLSTNEENCVALNAICLAPSTV